MQAAVDHSGEKGTRLRKCEKELQAAITNCDGVRVSLIEARNASEKIREKYETKIFELNTLNNDRGVVIENYAKDIARMQTEKNVLDGQIATQRKVIKEAKDATEEAITMIDGLHFQIAKFKGKPIAIEKLKAVVREISVGKNNGKFSVKLVDDKGKDEVGVLPQHGLCE